MKRLILIPFIIVICLKIQSQNFQYRVTDSLFFVDGNNNTIQYSATGGFHAPQFNSCDVNGDNKKDLVIYDKADGSITTLINIGNANEVKYKLDNRYAQYFPKLKPNSWMLMRDFNRDGYEDIFTIENVVQVYKNISYTVGGRPAFEAVPSLLFRNRSPQGSFIEFNQLNIPNIHLPGIYDMDNDGDLDICNFSNIGGAISYYKNFQEELDLPTDSMRFKLVNLMWGDFTDYNCNTYLLGQNNQKDSLKFHQYMRHTLGSSITLFDADNDNDIDMLLGNEGCNHMTLLYNGKKDHNKYFDTIINYDTSFVTLSNRVEVPIYPAAYFLDVDNDGKRDLIYAPNSTYNPIQETNQIFWLKNIGTDLAPQFSQKQPLFSDQTVDIGSIGCPAFYDWDSDGDMDLMVATNGDAIVTKNDSNSIYLFENVGNKTQAKFKLKNKNFGFISNGNLSNMTISVADMNNDGKTDIICGNDKGELKYFKNTSSTTNTLNPTFTLSNSSYPGFNIDAGSFSAPFVFDVNKDGLKDVLIGQYDTFIKYYENIGTLSDPDLIFKTSKYGKINPSDSLSLQYKYDYDDSGNYIAVDSFVVYEKFLYSGISVANIDNYGKNEILVSNARGLLRLYQMDSVINSQFVEYKNFNYYKLIANQKVYNIDFGQRIYSTFVDLDDDKTQEIVVACNKGGFFYLKPDFKYIDNTSINPVVAMTRINAYPNPSSKVVEFDINKNDVKSIEIYDITGKKVEDFYVVENEYNQLTISVEHLQQSNYVVVIKTNNGALKSAKITVVK